MQRQAQSQSVRLQAICREYNGRLLNRLRAQCLTFTTREQFFYQITSRCILNFSASVLSYSFFRSKYCRRIRSYTSRVLKLVCSSSIVCANNAFLMASTALSNSSLARFNIFLACVFPCNICGEWQAKYCFCIRATQVVVLFLLLISSLPMTP